ncbi:hypothetical protein LRU_00186 [Ligilactobacillus ruminis SPM0211]|uniref:Uncharacterized protein n=1 Tax=Ligilactobacillus ruminis SPM0211 TaxID=1040964 RepID=F7QXP2_9LACO|nr:hypothetical protein LRU_00186 [Ligilactobacillus ruminis SPM0211]
MIAIYGQILKNGILPVSHLDVLIEQAMNSAAFDKKFRALILQHQRNF